MAGNTIQIKRSAANTGPTAIQLQPGELAWVDHTDAGSGTTPTSNGTLYIKDAAANGSAVHKIGGPGFELKVLEDSVLTGTTTLNATAFNSGTDYINANNGEAVDTKWVMEAIAASGQPISSAGDTDIEADNLIADGEILIWDSTTDKWKNQELDGVTGDVSLAANGVATVTGAAANAIELGTMTSGNYVKSIVGGDNVDVTITSSGANSSSGGEEQSALTVALSSNVVISGNLDVNGTTTTVDTDIVKITDPTFLVGEHNTTADRGIEFKYGTSNPAQAGFFGYDQTNDKFTFELGTYDSSGDGSVTGGTVGNAKFGQIEGLLMDGAQTNITSVGNITAGQWNGTAISPAKGGTGIDTSAGQGKDTGALIVNNGTWDVEATLPVTYGGTGMSAALANTIVMGTGTAAMTTLAMGAANEMLKVKSDGSGLEYSAVIDGGTTF